MSLRLYLDEDVSARLAIRLISDGYDVLTASQAGRANLRISDEEQLAYAASTERAIFTHNIADYSKLAQSWAAAGREHAGIILSHRHPIRQLHIRFRAFMARYPDGMANVYDYL